jgi:mitogen-activated protein kinase kinase kinase kinase 5
MLLFLPVVVQNDSILAFHSQGMQGRSLRNGAITQEITDPSKNYKLLGSEKFVLQVSRENIF